MLLDFIITLGKKQWRIKIFKAVKFYAVFFVFCENRQSCSQRDYECFRGSHDAIFNHEDVRGRLLLKYLEE